jgi:hypothetical protein
LTQIEPVSLVEEGEVPFKWLARRDVNLDFPYQPLYSVSNKRISVKTLQYNTLPKQLVLDPCCGVELGVVLVRAFALVRGWK